MHGKSLLPGGVIDIDLVTHAFDSIPDEILVLDAAMNVQYANTSFLKNNELLSDSILGKHCRDIAQRICKECGLDSQKCHFYKARTEKKHDLKVRKRVEADGKTHYYSIVGAPILDDAGQLIGLLQMVRDITRRMSLEEELRATEIQLRQFMELAPIGTYIKDPSGRYLEVNPAACNMFGRTAAEMIGKTDDEIFTPETAAVMSADDDKVLGQGREITLSNQIIFEGNPVYLSTIKYPVLDMDGQVTAMGGLSIDVTKQKKAEFEVSRTREYLENIMDNSSVMIITTDLEGNVVSFNREAEETLLYKAEEVIGRPVSMFYDRPEERVTIGKAVEKQGVIRNLEARMRRKDGTTLDALVNLSLLKDSSGLTIGTVGITKDISKRKALIEQVAHTERQAVVGRLASGVAHEINNPLAMIGEIAGYLNDLLSEDAAAAGLDLMAELREGLPKIIGHVKMGRSITQRLLSFARRGEAKPEVTDVNAALKAALPFVARNARLARVTIHEKYTEGLASVGVEDLQLQEVFINIINNAIQALETKTDGNIWIETRALKHKVSVLIRDDGQGIADEVRDRLFDPFVTTKPRGKGTGLGLSICYGIVKRYGGEIRVDSKPGEGAEFEILFPSLEGKSAPPTSPVSS